ncbi:tRNA uridine-5-carboxymethylaminomethyl(34) synthesis GTPase MnmE [Blastochloris sulfoviridis]|uniref:tRNA modification GTPase MnmE n=1 Tax=Blastochloris sulfoviridis TaxID=50712 RepID=A0A5M6HXR0_9HYPH|nr:tRNA uridine-5-carboxymethylaminomethyl(34) synthesis GTPase MnmE [Blastochloris sulfoviridis]KAA5600408.1 tRNA uridine-5-carboxymethylaminomethyl(34) synthesis GTPase MnmE [Blastochloris sulfoviridis]
MRGAGTIFALSSGRPPAGVAVVRVSGAGARFALEALAGVVGAPRRMRLATLRDPATFEPLDRALTVFFPGPASATGEDIAEFHLHGGLAVVADVLAALGRLQGLRLAEPGDFTRRAFANGVMDLAAVEGLADLIGAATSGQRRQALAQASGALGAAVAGWRERLIGIAALVEASIDFSDEGDVPADLVATARTALAALDRDVAAALDGARRGERMRSGLVVVIAGPPNAGKSSLLNALARREVAIVSALPGTTRDAIEVHLDLDGLPVTVIDTAGLREGADPVEKEGIRRAHARMALADLVLWLEPADEPATPPPAGAAPVWRVGTKRDLAGGGPSDSDSKRDGVRHRVSTRSGAGLDALVADIAAAAAEMVGGEPPLVTRARQAQALDVALAALRDAGGRPDAAPELMAEDLRRAARALGEVVGMVDVEDVLDAIFRQFCVGK